MKKSRVFRFPQTRDPVTLEIMAHPDDIADVDPHIIEVMKARLSGELLDHFFAREDQVTDCLAIDRERQKLKAIFKNEDEVFGGFASLDAVRVTRVKLRDFSVDRELLSQYAHVKSSGEAVDEVDMYAHLVGGGELRSKRMRFERLEKLTLSPKAREIANTIAKHYLADDFGAFGVSKEMIEIESEIREQFKVGEVKASVDEVLNVLYKGIA